MKAVSCFSTNMDPYRAGVEIAEQLVSIQPEVVFLFPTIHYNGSPEMLDGIYDVLESDDIVLIGNTVDGFYEKNKVAGVGVSALALNSGGTVKWHLNHETGVGETPFDSTTKCITKLNESTDKLSSLLYFMTSDFRTDSGQIVAALDETAMGPVIGGLAADDSTFENCFIYANKEVLSDSIAILAMEGSLSFSISVANTLQPMGEPGIVSESSGTSITSINNIPAMDFVERAIGKPLEVIDQGLLTLKLTSENSPNEKRVLSLLLPDDRVNDSSVKLFEGVEEGKHVQVCLAPVERILQDVKDVGKSIADLPFKPIAALIVSCAGRKRVLGDSLESEVQEILNSCPGLEALAGFPSFGEFGSLKLLSGYSKPLFHNMTFILLLIGE